MAKVLIAGCGDVGTALGERLVAAGHTVWGLRRRVESLPAGILPIQADLELPRALAALPKGLEIVFYAAAGSAFSEEGYRKTYVEGLRNLLEALKAGTQPVSRLIFVSSTGVYGHRQGEWVDERSPTQPEHFSGQVMLEAERVALEGPYPAIAVRFGGIYGPGRNRLVETVRRGDPCVDAPPTYTNRIHRDDCAAVLHHLVALERPESLYLGVDSHPAPQCEVMDWLASRLGVPPPLRVSAAPGDSPQRGSKRCRNDRLLASGYRFLYPSYREGYAAVLRQGTTGKYAS